jgi:hypothetical protein
MTNAERESSAAPSAGNAHQELPDPDLRPLAAALRVEPQERLDGHLGPGVVFALGDPQAGASLELYPQVVRVTLPHAQLAVTRREAEVSPDGVVLQDSDRFVLAVGAAGEVVFRSWPTATAGAQESTGDTGEPERSFARSISGVPERFPAEDPESLPRPAAGTRRNPDQAQAQETAKSERYVGRLGEVRTHQTKQGKLVAEVEITVADPDRPGSSVLVKFAAFGDKAEALAREYHPGQEVTAVGIPHELRRRGADGREWTERQLYFVQLPKPR